MCANDERGPIGPIGRIGTRRAIALGSYKRTQSVVSRLSLARGIGFVSQGPLHLTLSRIGFVSHRSSPSPRSEGYIGPISESLGLRCLHGGITPAGGVPRPLRTGSTDRQPSLDTRRLTLAVCYTKNQNYDKDVPFQATQADSGLDLHDGSCTSIVGRSRSRRAFGALGIPAERGGWPDTEHGPPSVTRGSVSRTSARGPRRLVGALRVRASDHTPALR
jgi:hypothetical protein